jgi:phage terminase small subunit
MTRKTQKGEGATGPEITQSRSLTTTKAEIFTEALLANGLNAAKAAREAGYIHPAKEGQRRVARPEMQALIQERIEAAAVRTDEVMGSLVVIMREHTGSEDPAMVRNAIAATTQLCKVLGMQQRPRPNQHDQQTREMFEGVIVRYSEKYGLARAEVVERMLAINPEMGRWVSVESGPGR